MLQMRRKPTRLPTGPDRQGPGKAEAHHADQEEAPFVCYLQDTDIEASAMSANDMSTAEATRLGYGVIDGGAHPHAGISPSS